MKGVPKAMIGRKGRAKTQPASAEGDAASDNLEVELNLELTERAQFEHLLAAFPCQGQEVKFEILSVMSFEFLRKSNKCVWMRPLNPVGG